MIDLYTWKTPNGRKISIALEEMRLAYQVHPIDIGKGEQFEPDFLAISPNNKIPAILDGDFALMESGAILMYLAEKSGKLLAEHGTETYWRTVEWLMWQVGGFGPLLGQAHHFLSFNRGVSEYAESRYHDEARRLYSVLDRRLSGRDFVADEFSIADIAIWCWASRYELQDIDLDDYPAVLRWYRALAARPSFRRGYAVPDASAEIPLP